MSLERRNVIFHIDVNSAFLSWEAVYRLHHLGGKEDLREKVSAVGGDMAMRHGIILAKSVPAKKFHIKTGETILEAKQKCPELILVPPNYGLYEKCSQAFMDILRQYSPAVEQYSIDEAFVDMTGTEGLWGDAVTAAYRMKDQIRDTLGFTVNIGISENKLLAKMASDFQKPDRVHTLWREEIPDKMWPLPASDLFFVGRATAKKLFNLGIHTIGELAHADPHLLKVHLKKHGEVIWAFANNSYIKMHTFTLSGDERVKSEQIQPVTGSVKVTGTADTDVVFTDIESGETYAIGYITSGTGGTIKLERGKWYRVEGVGELTVRPVNVRIE